MNIFKKIIYFLSAYILHLILMYFFASEYYLIYFISLLFALYLLHKSYNYFSITIFFISTALSIIMINSKIYDEYLFEFFLFIDVLDRTIYVNSEIMYILVLLHLLFLINLKKFETIWAIIDEKLFRT